MRTTLDIEKPVLAELKKLQQKTHQSLGKLASSLIGEALTAKPERSDPAVQAVEHLMLRAALLHNNLKSEQHNNLISA